MAHGDRAEIVHVHGKTEIVDRASLDHAEHADTRVVHQHVDPAQPIGGLGHAVRHAGRVVEVERDEPGVGGPGKGGQRMRLAPNGADDPVAMLDDRLHQRFAKAARHPGDEPAPVRHNLSPACCRAA